MHYFQQELNIGREVRLGESIIYPPNNFFLYLSSRKGELWTTLYGVIPISRKDINYELFIFKNIKKNRSNVGIQFFSIDKIEKEKVNKVLNKFNRGEFDQDTMFAKVGYIFGLESLIIFFPKERLTNVTFPSIRISANFKDMAVLKSFSVSHAVKKPIGQPMGSD